MIHLAAIVGGIANFHKLPHTLTEVNNALYNAVVRAAIDGQVERFVYVSSSMVFERAELFPTPEDYLPQCPVPISAYGYSKLTGEVYCRAAHEEHGLPYTICRPFNAYGPGEVPDAEPGIAHAVPDLINKVLAGQRPLQIFGSGEQTRTLTHVDDIADGYRHRDELAGRPQRGLQHLGLARADGRRDRPDRLAGLRAGRRRPSSNSSICRRFAVDVQRRWPSGRRLTGCSAGRPGSASRMASRRPSPGCARAAPSPPAKKSARRRSPRRVAGGV